MNYSIAFVDKISDVEEDKMTKDLVAYESSHGIDVNLSLQEQEKQVLNALPYSNCM